MVELDEVAQAVWYRGVHALVVLASERERIERRRRQKEERGLEGDNVERNKGWRWNGGN